MLETLKAKIIISIIFALLASGATWRVLSWREQAHKVDELETQVSTLKDEKQALVDKAAEDQKAAVKRLAEAAIKRVNDEATIKTLRGQLAKSPNIVIPIDKLQALRNADSAN